MNQLFTCVSCGGVIPAERLTNLGTRTRYCSDQCNKHDWYLNHLKPGVVNATRNPHEWQQCASGKAYRWEEFAANLLGAKHQSYKSPYDLTWKSFKVDVKIAELFKRKTKNGKPVSRDCGTWYFHTS